MDTDDPVPYAATPARLRAVYGPPGTGRPIERLVYPMATVTEPYGELKQMPAWRHQRDAKGALADGCPETCTCAKSQGWPYEMRRPLREVRVRAEGPPRLVTDYYGWESPEVTYVTDAPARDHGRTPHSRAERRAKSDTPRLVFGTDLAPDPEPLAKPGYLATLGHDDPDGVRVIGHEVKPRRDHLAITRAKTSRDEPPAHPENAWTPDERFAGHGYRMVRVDHFGREYFRVVRTEELGDAPLPTWKPAEKPYPSVDLADPVMVHALLIRLDRDLPGLLDWASGAH